MTTDNGLIGALRAKANKLRIHSIRATTAAGSGHPTTCMSAAEIMSVLFFKVMRYDPKNPSISNADRFVLSKGHAAPILYAAWAEAGLFPVEDLLNLRKIDSDLEGHPTPRLPFADVATGSLGQGLGVGVGLALNSKFLDKTNYRTYVLMGDGESAEGSVWEAAELGGYYKLDNLVAIVDVNRLGQSQHTMLEHDMGTYVARFKAFGWEAVSVDGHNVEELLQAFDKAASTKGKPFAILAKTVKGQGFAEIANKDGWHGKPLKKDEADRAIAEIEAAGTTSDYELKIEKPTGTNPTEADVQPIAVPTFKKGESMATREAYGFALAALGAADPRVVAIDADTKNSTYSDKFLKAFPDRFFEAFIMEQNMISVAAGLASRDKVPFASSFAVFLSRGFDQIRMAGVSHSNIKLCGSHVGVSIGEDGPSQMGLEDLALYRTIPNCVVFYPSDAVSAYRAVELASKHDGIAYIRTSRPKTEVIYDAHENFQIGCGKVVRKSAKDAITVVSAGVTLFETLKAADEFEKQGVGVRVIDLFTIKPIDRALLLSNAQATGNRLLTVEDHYPEGGIGEAVAGALDDTDVKIHRIAVREIPRSGPPEALMQKYGIDAGSIIEKIKGLL